MKNSLLITLTKLLLSAIAIAQPDTLWTRTYGGTEFEECSCIRQTYDGGFIISGSMDNSGNTDALLLKIDASGAVEWSQTYGGEDDDYANDVIQTDDEGFILTGYTNTENDGFEVIVVKTDSMGIEEWSGTYGNHYSYDIGYGIDKTMDGGYVISGEINIYTGFIWDVFFMKIDSTGNELWSNSWDGIGFDIEVTSDGGCIIVGHTSAMGYFDIYVKLIKTDASGNPEWERLYGDTSSTASGYSVQQTMDGGYIITGYKNEPDTSSYCTDVYLLKVDSNGDEVWSQMFGGIHGDIGNCVQQTTDEGYIITGYTSIESSNRDIYLVRTDSDGNELWSQTYGGDLYDSGYSVRQTTDEGYIVAGNTNSLAPSCIYLIRLGADNNVEEYNSTQPKEFILFPPCPNPFNQSTAISYQLLAYSHVNLTVYDVMGREVGKLVDGYKTAGNHEIIFDAGDLVSGVYFVRLNVNGGQSMGRKMVLMK